MLIYGAGTYQYTLTGTLTNKSVGGQATAYNYDAMGNLLNVTLPDTTEITYSIDAVGRRIGKKVNGTVERKYLYQDQINPVAEYNASGGMVAYYVYATRGHVPDYMVRSGETYRIISDHLGSVRMVVNISDSTVAQRMDFDEFGNVLTDTNPGFQPFGFAGGLYDPDTELTRFGYRDYDPETGRWQARDPIGFGGGQVNLYVYCNNCPIMFIDPIGLSQAFFNGVGNSVPSRIQANIFSMSYASQNSAAKFASWNIQSQPVEYGGYISQVDTSFIIHPPRTDNNPKLVSLPGVGFYPNSTAWYHNHPSDSQDFSRIFPGSYGDASVTVFNFRLTDGRNATAYMINKYGQIYRMDAQYNDNGGIVLGPTVNITSSGQENK